MLRQFAEDRLLELQAAMKEMVSHPQELAPMGGKELLAQAMRGDVIVIDVRPKTEYLTAHLPHARSIPLAELRARLGEDPKGKPIVAHCRGAFCLIAIEAVGLLAMKGIQAARLEDGVAEWRARGLPLPNDR